jgi:hypothetical protein
MRAALRTKSSEASTTTHPTSEPTLGGHGDLGLDHLLLIGGRIRILKHLKHLLYLGGVRIHCISAHRAEICSSKLISTSSCESLRGVGSSKIAKPSSRGHRVLSHRGEKVKSLILRATSRLSLERSASTPRLWGGNVDHGVGSVKRDPIRTRITLKCLLSASH